MDDREWAEAERKERKDDRLWKGLALLAALALAFGIGLILGGGLTFGLTRLADWLPSTGSQGIDPDMGILVASVADDGPVAAAGLVRGDILLEMDGEQLDSTGDLTRRLAGYQPGDKVELRVLHGDEVRNLTVTLGSRNGQAYLGLVPSGGIRVEERTLQEPGTEMPAPSAGARIVEVMAGSPADEAGLQAGDVIVAVDGVDLGAGADLTSRIAGYEPGDRVTLQVEAANGQAREMRVILGDHPDRPGSAYLGVRYTADPGLQMPGRQGPPFGQFRDFDQLPMPGRGLQQGAIILSVAEGSPAAEAGLKEGDLISAVDGEAIDSPDGLADAIAAYSPGDRVTLTVNSAGAGEEADIKVTLAAHPDDKDRAYLGVSIGGFFRRGNLDWEELPQEFGMREGPFFFQIPPGGAPMDPDALPFNLDELPFDLDQLPFDLRDLPFNLDELPFDWPGDPQPFGSEDQSV
jgi:S1-C subfamily serine protease